ncbi:hypothetical protein AGABI2DRAFT_189269 [Agaricus bisporus var. bisporus H97]|uniref:hypothetical protein n=1 Tax=Agaricus bisporus var. bisporus (strain H97 / ATCC MYA-4626 / FGSC 10389) TaxID=936046 RepID=UPI00029F6641|nr:hypothetical protein AGABI2DRAFT_189269 [Agaricus bisporus var. bisporus H97]EKV50959.1 hypothetical protein AGABI2DRAFT_189269 [Agaricus bisporus var. bisporus H97]
MGLLILTAIFVFLRRRRRREENIMPYSPVETRRSPGGVLTHELPPMRTVTPLIWPQHQSRASIESTVSVHDAGRQPVGSSNSEVVTNPFEPVPTAHRLVDVASVRSSRNSFPSNPFEDNANTFIAGYQKQGSLGTADMVSGSRREGENSVVTASSSATVMGYAQANHNRHLSYASTDCPYPVLEPTSPARHISIKSGLSYATIDPERAAKLQAQPQLARYSAISSTSSSGINVGYAI